MRQLHTTKKSADYSSSVVNGLILFTSFPGLLVFGFSVKKISDFLDSGLPVSFYLFTSAVGLGWFFIFIFCLTLSRDSKRSLLLLTFSTLGPIWAAELFLSTFPTPITDGSINLESLADTRPKVRVIHDLRAQGLDAYPNIPGSALLKTDGIEVPNGSLTLLPVGSISDVTTVYCNESGAWSIYKSDEHGFNNPSGNYLADQVDILLTGDSFTEGACVEPTETIAAVLRNNGLRVISLGKGGNGPLLQFASFVEYAKPIRPKVLIWMHYANDIHDLAFKELRSSKLREYIEGANYSQGLKKLQPEIDAALKHFVATQYANKLKAVAESGSTINPQIRPKEEGERISVKKENLIEFIKLTRLRELLDLRPSRPNPEQAANSAYRLILQRVKNATSLWGSHLYLAYLPAYEVYQTGRDHDIFYRDFVLRTAQELEIPVIDLHKEVFSTHSDPLALFPKRKARHYNAQGYQLVANEIHRRLTQDQIIGH